MKKIEFVFKLKNMRKQVSDELNYIPRGDEDQNALRQLYWTFRMRSLGKKPFEYKDKNRREILDVCILMVKEENPDFEPKYDKKFFDMKITDN